MFGENEQHNIAVGLKWIGPSMPLQGTRAVGSYKRLQKRKRCSAKLFLLALSIMLSLVLIKLSDSVSKAAYQSQSQSQGLQPLQSDQSLETTSAPEGILSLDTGALDRKGRPGYVHDPYFLKKHPLNFTFRPEGKDVCEAPLGEGDEGNQGIFGLRKIKVVETPSVGIRVMCIVYSYSGHHDIVRALAETYGPRCDGFLVSSNLTDPTIGAVNILHRGDEAYGNMWQKVRATWQYVHDNYLEDFDFFHIGGDNMFVIAENLRYAARQFNSSEPAYFGAAMLDPQRVQRVFCGGGAGYTLSREALRRLIHDFSRSHCKPNGERSDEDRAMGICLKFVAKCTHVMDEQNETRYHHFDADFHVSWKRGKRSNWNWKDLLKHHGIQAYKEKLESVSKTSATFHLYSEEASFRDRGLRRYHALLFGLCKDRKLPPLTRKEILLKKVRHKNTNDLKFD